MQSPEEHFKLEGLTVEHNECVHEGGHKCVFEVKYKSKSFFKSLIKYVIVAGLGAVVYLFGSRISPSTQLFSSALLLTYIVSVMLLTFVAKFWEIIKSHTVFYELDRAKEQDLYQSKLKLDRRYQELNMIRDLTLRTHPIQHSQRAIRKLVERST